MAGVEGTAARRLDFEDGDAEGSARAAVAAPRLRLAPGRPVLRGPDKYKVLEHRRRQAQIAARHVVGLFD